ncbi:hypothetical protein OSSY52_15570 [Tepiditoga spiralis]|uniref:Thiamine biosynthesis protein ThiS n=1 Tax=Tepiditoga spiralis TaxID=2108365 RepID=A0A7G1G7Q6_9BACT|nr:sulfur carrier protein ThiS [Tepiditoga spiralis]BBE31416.1 hypothetical protein OSSY52_15570 [Tepiditoga spiralis]
MRIIFNGREEDIEKSNFYDLLEKYNIDEKKVVLILNNEILKKEDYKNNLNENDKIEVITVVGGG